jgi:hypothetical protein
VGRGVCAIYGGMNSRSGALLWATCTCALLTSSLGCRTQSSPEPRPAASATQAPAVQAGQRYGAPLRPEQPTELAAVLREPDSYQGKTVTVKGEVRRACTRKGCWMELAQALDPKLPGCRVTFKDYSFFVPTDSAGARATVQGVVEVQTIKAGHVRHLEEEGATFASKLPDGSAKETQIVAYGVELQR